jgi:type I restriction enzyme S subunit
MSFMSGATREKITQEDMGRIPVPNLSPTDQAALAARLRAEQSRVDAMTKALDKRVELLLERRRALITAAVTGQLEFVGVPA